ncbi:hypothetical protein [Microseira wollei]|uniref:Transposase n=1 Tax=Microseira wollei NIES-4236 TaxID=2530354 RepID=A0AAV3XT34_9CYAN|nr:hypothetical protein [Microseira wollei]GET44369.1 hypothetical protein MiSe_91960 [Microseira wollei NIES-4236]
MNEADEIQNLKLQIEDLQVQLLKALTRANRAKDISPVERPSFRRVVMLVRPAWSELKKVAGGGLLFMGKLQRQFKSLKEIWLLLTQENWYLSDIFPPQKAPLEFKDAPPRLPKYPNLTKQIFDWQTGKPPANPEESQFSSVRFTCWRTTLIATVNQK